MLLVAKTCLRAESTPLKYLSKFWRTLEMPLINCEISLILTWSANCCIVSGTMANQVPIFAITDAKIYVPVVTLSTQDYFISPTFQGVNRLFVLLFSENTVRTGDTRYFLPTVETKDYNVMIDGQNIFDQPVRNDQRKNDNII